MPTDLHPHTPLAGALRRRAPRAALTGLALLLLPTTSASALVPAHKGEYPNGTVVTGTCAVVDRSTSDVLDQWVVFSLLPDRHHTTGGGQQLIPSPYPRRVWDVEPTETGYGPVLEGQGARAGDDCRTAATRPLSSELDGDGVRLTQAGIYLYHQVHQTVTWKAVARDTPVVAEPCDGIDPVFDAPAPLQPPASSPGPNGKWAITAYCAKVTSATFTVTNDAGDCPVAAQDLSRWPEVPYFNQYDAGVHEGLPRAQVDNKIGGNACGPSSTMMGVLESLKHAFPGDTPEHRAAFEEMVGALPSIGEFYDRVMQKTRAQLAALDGPGNNKAIAAHILSMLKSMGWSQARHITLGDSVQDVAYGNQQALTKALGEGPVILSTSFGQRRWGLSGGGHVILLRNLDVRHPLDYIVNDPAGNFFSKSGGASYPGGHYGAGSCGFGVAYPMDWVHAHSAGRWAVAFGRPDGAWAQTGARRATGTPAPGRRGLTPHPVFELTLPADGAPGDLWVQDAAGRRAGFVDGRAVTEIPGADVGEAQDADLGPGGEDEDTPGPDEQPVRRRHLVVPDPGPGATLHAGGGATVPAQARSYTAGRVVREETLELPAGAAVPVASEALQAAGVDGGDASPAPGAGAPGAIPAPSGTNVPPTRVDAPKPPVTTVVGPRLGTVRAKGSAVAVTLRCTAATGRPCRGTVVLTVRRGRRTVLVGSLPVQLTGGARRTVTVPVGPGGRRLLRRAGRLRVTVGVRTAAGPVGGVRLVTVRHPSRAADGGRPRG